VSATRLFGASLDVDQLPDGGFSSLMPHSIAPFAIEWALRSDGTLADHDNSLMIARHLVIDICEHELKTSQSPRHPLIRKERE
jgi:hypothetical protein